jgi:hypothetical protein
MEPKTSIEKKNLTVSVQVLLAIIISTGTICFTVISQIYEVKESFSTALRQIETENKIQDMKLENIQIQVDRNKLIIEQMRDATRRKDE